MDEKTILIMGGYGNTGRPFARLLLQETGARIIIAGRNMDKANLYVDELNRNFEAGRAACMYIDASDPLSLSQAFVGIDFVVVASSTTQYIRQVAEAALKARIGYLDIQYSTQKIANLKSMAPEIQKSGCCFITDGGFHPGLPAFLVRFVAQSFDQLFTARVGSVIKEDWMSLQVEESTIYELVELINDYEMTIFKDGKWKKVSLLSTADYLTMDFGGTFGKQFCAPMLLEEMRMLPDRYPSLTGTGFYVGSFNWYVDWIIMPISLLGMKLWPKAAVKPMGRWMYWGLKTFSKPPYGTMLKVEAQGRKEGQLCSVNVTISHPDGYLFTAIPVAACLLQYLDGSIDKPGLWLQAHIVEPNRFLSDMQRMGITAEQGAG